MFRKEENRNLVSDYIRRTASMHEIKIIELNVQPEHVYCVILVKFSLSSSKVLQILKRISARLYFEKKQKARLRYPHGCL